MGSPPQVRGKPQMLSGMFALLRITPAGAGKTCRSWWRRVCSWDHPRRCGENQTPHRERYHKTGSPPQVRGKPVLIVVDIVVWGITPAGAGKTPCRRLSRR